jgi:hypothetical protein
MLLLNTHDRIRFDNNDIPNQFTSHCLFYDVPIVAFILFYMKTFNKKKIYPSGAPEFTLSFSGVRVECWPVFFAEMGILVYILILFNGFVLRNF